MTEEEEERDCWIYDVTFDDEVEEALMATRISQNQLIALRYRDTQGALFCSDPV